MGHPRALPTLGKGPNGAKSHTQALNSFGDLSIGRHGTELQEQNMRAIPEDSLLHSESLNNTYDTVQSQQLKAPKSRCDVWNPSTHEVEMGDQRSKALYLQ